MRLAIRTTGIPNVHPGRSPSGLLLLATVGALALWGLVGCDRPRYPEFRTLERVKLRGARLDGKVLLTAEAVFHNPNPVGADLTAMDLRLSLDGRQVATVRQDVTATAPAGADFRLPIRIEVPAREISEDLGDLLGGILSGRSMVVEIDGHIVVEVAGVELRAPLRYEEVRELRF